MNQYFHTPVACSDDVPPDQPLSFQTGQIASVPDVQPDAEKVKQSRTPEKPVVQGNPSGASASGLPPSANRTRDTIEITGKSGGKIKTEGLASVLQPGGVFVLGDENRMVIHRGAHSEKRNRRKNKYKLTESTAEPVIRHLDIISAGLAEDWYDLGHHLGLSDAALKQIELDFKVEGQHEVNYRVLARWKQTHGPVTVHMLAKALVEIGRGDLADELRRG